jgi:hypothetical protein
MNWLALEQDLEYIERKNQKQKSNFNQYKIK